MFRLSHYPVVAMPRSPGVCSPPPWAIFRLGAGGRPARELAGGAGIVWWTPPLRRGGWSGKAWKFMLGGEGLEAGAKMGVESGQIMNPLRVQSLLHRI